MKKLHGNFTYVYPVSKDEDDTVYDTHLKSNTYIILDRNKKIEKISISIKDDNLTIDTSDFLKIII